MFKILPLVLALAIIYAHSADGQALKCKMCLTDCKEAAKVVDGPDPCPDTTPQCGITGTGLADAVFGCVAADALGGECKDGTVIPCKCATALCNTAPAATGPPPAEKGVGMCYMCDKDCANEPALKDCPTVTDKACVITADFEFKCSADGDSLEKCPDDGLMAKDGKGCMCMTEGCNKKKKGDGEKATDAPGEPDGSTSNVASGILILLSALFAGWMQVSEIKL